MSQFQSQRQISKQIINLNQPGEDKQRGMTLIEILIAMVLGLFLLGGIMQIFVNTRKTHDVQDELARLQENGRLAIDLMGRDLRMADYRDLECEGYDYIAPNQPLSGVDDDPASPNDLGQPTDTITARWVTFTGGACSIVNNNKAFSIDNTSGLHNSALGSDEFVEGVENMQIQYGIDTNTDGIANYYDIAPPIGNDLWEQVVSVRVSLLLRSVEDNLVPQPLNYVYNGQQIVSPDRRIRRVFSSTFVLRNRVP